MVTPLDSEALAGVLAARAVLATGVSVTVADARADDVPLVWVNPAFSLTTGYAFDEAVGRNCRFLQGPDTDPVVVRRMREAVEAGTELTAVVLNYRKDGRPFYNSLTMSPVVDEAGVVTHVVGIQVDVTDRVLAEAQRSTALEAAERARRRTTLLAEATSLLARTLDADEALARLADLCVPELCDYVLVTQLDGRGQVRVVAARHRSDQALLDAYVRLGDGILGPESVTAGVLAGGPPRLVPHVPLEHLDRAHQAPEAAALMRRMGAASAVVVPLEARGRSHGVLSFVRADDSLPYDEDDLEVAIDLGRRAALSVDNARLYQAEHAAALTLQRSLLPLLPPTPGWEVAPHYSPGDSHAEVGGDLYDLLLLDDGALGLVVGDVVGHDLEAAAAMGHLRGLLRAVAVDGPADPAEVLARLDRLVQGLPSAPLATLLYARLEPLGDDRWALSVASAGHPPLVVGVPGGTRLVGEPGLMLGVGTDASRPVATAELGPGDVVVGCTDGLVERRGEAIDAGLERLRAVVERSRALPAQDLLDAVLGDLHPDGSDDTALLVARCRPAG